MKLVLQHPYPNACALACLAMLADVTLDAVIKANGGSSERPPYETRNRLFTHFGIALPKEGYLIESFGDQTVAALMKKHSTMLCSVYSYIDGNFGHYVVLHEGQLYDPWDGMNPAWPWHRHIGQVQAIALPASPHTEEPTK